MWIDKKYVPKWLFKSKKGENGGKVRDLLKSQYCICTVTDVSEAKGFPDKENPMETVNRVHRFIELFFKRHGG